MTETRKSLTLVLQRVFLLAFAYFLGGKLGLSMPYLGPAIALIWPPTGIAISALMLWGFSCWPGIFLGSLAVNLSTGISPLASVVIALGNTIGPALAAGVMRWSIGSTVLFERGRDVFLFMTVVLASMVVTATTGVLSLVAGGGLPISMVGQGWLSWWLGDTVGAWVFVPPLLLWTEHRAHLLRKPWEVIEFCLVISVCVASAWFVAGAGPDSGNYRYSLTFLVFPPLIWAGLRFDGIGASTGALAISMLAAWGTFNGVGPFAWRDPQLDQTLLCAFVAATSIIALMITGMQTARNKTLGALRKSEERLRLALTAANQGLFDLDVQSGTAKVSVEYARLLGYQPEEFHKGNECWPDRLHPNDRDATVHVYRDYIAGLRDDYKVEFRQRCKNGDWKWILSLGQVVEWDTDGRPLRMLGTHTDITERKAMENALRQSEAGLLRAQTLAHLGSWSLDLGSYELTWSPETYRIFGVEEGTKLTYETFLQLVAPDDRAGVDRSWRAALQGAPYDIEHRIMVGGSLRWVRERAELEADEFGQVRRGVGTVQDITERKHAEEDLHRTMEELLASERDQRELRALAEREQHRLAALLSAMNTGILFEDNQRNVEYVNPAFLKMWGLDEGTDFTGMPTAKLLARSSRRLAESVYASRCLLNIEDNAISSERSELELCDGRTLTQLSYPVTNAWGFPLGRLWLYEDVTQERQTAEQLLYLAERDPLTGLYNRHRFQQEIEKMIAVSLRTRGKFVLLYFDLDDFKYINDTFGHTAGDIVLTRTAGEVSNLVRHSELFARLGGDEFAVLSVLQPGDDINALPARIVRAVSSIPLHFQETSVRLTSSVGLAIFPEHGENADDLVAHADTAMYQAKNHGKNTWAIYDPTRDVSQAMVNRLSWNSRIGQALKDDLFALHFQGIYETAQGKLTHAEVLVRMRNACPSDMLIMPGQFVPIAEKSGQIVDIDRWVVRRSIELLSQHPNMPPLAINISGRTFDDPSLPQFIRNQLVERGVDPHRLIVELTETAAVSDIQDAQRFIEAIRKTGCRVCLDDFGSGFSTFGYLKYLEVEVLKIDGLFIRDLANNRDNQVLVKAMVDIARGLRKTIVAEFVEDAATLKMIRTLGVDLAQGYYLGYPSPDLPFQNTSSVTGPLDDP